jgi:hypothetical protein
MSAYSPITEATRPSGEVVDLTALDDSVTVVYGDDEQPGDTRVAVKCDGCGEWYDADLWENGDGQWGNLDDSSLCPGCDEQDAGSDYGSTIHRFVPGEEKSEHEYVLFGDHNAYGCAEDYTDEPFDWFTELLPSPWPGRKYIRTDAWRGYYNTQEILVGLTSVENGWTTGDYSDVPWKKDIHTFIAALSEGEIEPPCTIFILFEPTSNVFSMGTDLLCKDEDAEALTAWLAQSAYDLHRALS